MTRPLQSLPKAHLHAHLDGSYPLAAVQALADGQGLKFEQPNGLADVWSFFDAYGTVPALVNSHDDLAVLCQALVAQEAAESVFYFEPAIEPQLYAPRLGSLEQVTKTMLAAFAEAGADAGIEVGALLTINTDQSAQLADELATIAVSHRDAGVTAFGTAGFVEPVNLSPFRSAVATARDAGLPIVSHAGQTGGPECVAQVLDEFGATRISHGFRSVESPDLMVRLADEGIVCDVCPVSNHQLGLVADLATHPVVELAASGVPVTLNADDQLWFGASITDQYQLARDLWHLDDDALAGFARAGLRASGMSDHTRAAMEAGINQWLGGGRT